MSNTENDILLLNNDTILTENALFTLRMGLYENDRIGAASSVSNYATQQTISKSFNTLEEYMNYGLTNNIPKDNTLEYRIFLSGFAFLLKRSAYKITEDLDEQFFPGNYADNDYCTRLIFNDYKLVLCNNSFIYHYGNSTFEYLTKKTGNTYNFYSEDNRQRYIKKWNINSTYSYYCRHDLLHLMNKQDKSKTIHVLDIGCAYGATLLGIKNKFPNACVYGIELDKHSASFASHIANVVQGNAEILDNPFPVTYDYILMGDILEHLVHPEELLKKIRNWLSPQGVIIASIPNILHYSAIIPILQGDFAYSDSGILDRTHLRFFTLYNSVKLLENSGYHIMAYHQNRTPDSYLNDENFGFIEQLSQLPNVVNKEDFLTIQYIFKACVNKK